MKITMDIVGNVKNAFAATLNLAKAYIVPMFFGLVFIGIIVGFVPAAGKFLQ